MIRILTFIIENKMSYILISMRTTKIFLYFLIFINIMDNKKKIQILFLCNFINNYLNLIEIQSVVNYICLAFILTTYKIMQIDDDKLIM